MRRVNGLPLWIGNARDARDLRLVHDTGIEAIVDLAVDEPPVQPTRELAYLRFPLVDGGGNAEWLLRGAVEAVAGLMRAGVPTLVACSAGMSRSLAVAAAGVAIAVGESPNAALVKVRGSGPSDLHPALWQAAKTAAGFVGPNEGGMSRPIKTLDRVLTGTADANIAFADLCGLLTHLGFAERVRGSHHIFAREGVDEILNLQPGPGGKAKPYQVKQVRDVIVDNALAADTKDEQTDPEDTNG